MQNLMSRFGGMGGMGGLGGGQPPPPVNTEPKLGEVCKVISLNQL